MAHDRFLQFHAPVFTAARQHLQPEVAHFVGGLIAAAHSPGWMVRISRIAVRVVVMKAHRCHASLGQEHRRRVAVYRLPVHIPVRNANQRFAGPVGQRSVAFEEPAQIMGVRVNCENVHVHRYREVVTDRKVAGAGRNVERAIALELHQHGKLRSRVVGEIEPDGRLDNFRFAGGLHVYVQDQVRRGVCAPRHAVGFLPWNAAGLPEQEMAVGIERVRFNAEIHAGES